MYLKQFLTLYAYFMCLNIKGVYTDDPVVLTSVGTIRGVRATDGNYSMFMGIPYATVDRDNPFGESTPYRVFNETFDATNDTAACPQVNSTVKNNIIGSLDCLQLFIYVPYVDGSNSTKENIESTTDIIESRTESTGNYTENSNENSTESSVSSSINNKASLPVFVFIHGGSFIQGMGGRSLYGPKYIMKHNVIFVTLNYRLGPYGFLCLDIPEVSGNQGLRDQLIALRWIKSNIAAFGGDPNNITLAGESAGGFSVHLHLLSKNEILYNKLILQSGIRTLTTDVITDTNNSVVFQIASHLGNDTSNIYEALSFLTNCSTDLVINATTDLDIVCKPCKEMVFDGIEPFITKSSFYSNVTKVKDIPVLMGFMRDEMASAASSRLDENLNLVLLYLKQTFNCSEETIEELKSMIGHFYFGDAGSNTNLTLDSIRFDSDYTYIYAIQKVVAKYLRAGAQNVYYYQLSYSSEQNSWPGFAAHAEELWFLFDRSGRRASLTNEDKVIIDRLTTMWTNFVKYSDPTPETTDLLPVKWLPATNETYYFLNIDTELSLDSRPLHDKMAFWDVFFRLVEKYDNCVAIN